MAPAIITLKEFGAMAELKTRVVRISGIPEEMLAQPDERVAKRWNGGRSQYVRDLIKQDLLARPERAEMNPVAQSVDEAMAVFDRIESRDTSRVKPLAPGADSREAIYGARGIVSTLLDTNVATHCTQPSDPAGR